MTARRRQSLAWITVIALAMVVRALLPATMAMPQTAGDAWPFGTLVICTPQGLKVIDSGDGQTPTPQPRCDLCTLVCHATAITTGATAVPLPVAAIVLVRLRPSDSPQRATETPRAAPARGPPAFA